MIPIANGVWPTMITPYTENDQLDFGALEKTIEWYIDRGVHGLFAVCQSSEMFYLSLEERVELAAFVKKQANGRVPVIASGHISDRWDDQVEELNRFADTGIDGLVLITNRLAAEDESEEILKRNLEKLLHALPSHVPLGFYECPYPYKRLVSPKLLKWANDTGRFSFLKDTSCDVGNMAKKLEAIQGGTLKIYNANSATLLETLKLGVHGYSGVMANMHPELYVWLYEHWQDRPEEAERLSSFLSIGSFIERQLYPTNAKYHFMLEGLLEQWNSRVHRDTPFTPTQQLEVKQLRKLARYMHQRL